ncbi:hypothetical protein ACIBO5_02675 [Nonomuraea angiospora]|uniref:hypothetical protein n=1 Tax=Nonomuraea angiospora TaxID=46172 RepID=UPI0029B626D8|nr:hypothetical protein [Nonomuraea angiospora]MDX3107932.1 hypothetical protein [Nonomuraea angiospora]
MNGIECGVEGSTIAEAFRVVGMASDTYGPTLNTGVSPGDIETIGRAMADALRGYRPAAVVIWNTSDEAVLAHVIARELDISVVRAEQIEGVVVLHPDVAPGTEVALIATTWDRPEKVTTLQNLIATKQADVTVVAAVLHTPALDTTAPLPTVCLTRSVDGQV